jgi:hypothetical protein
MHHCTSYQNILLTCKSILPRVEKFLPVICSTDAHIPSARFSFPRSRLLAMTHDLKLGLVQEVPPCVILNEVKNPYLSRTATIGVKEPQEWILRLAFGKSQNDT